MKYRAMHFRFLIRGVVAVAALTMAPLSAQPATDRTTHPPDAASKAGATPLSEGEVRKVDKGTGKLTIRHGELRNLDMPAMTMVFQVADESWLDQVKVGDKVNFAAEKVGGAYVVTRFTLLK